MEMEFLIQYRTGWGKKTEPKREIMALETRTGTVNSEPKTSWRVAHAGWARHVPAGCAGVHWKVQQEPPPKASGLGGLGFMVHLPRLGFNEVQGRRCGVRGLEEPHILKSTAVLVQSLLLFVHGEIAAGVDLGASFFRSPAEAPGLQATSQARSHPPRSVTRESQRLFQSHPTPKNKNHGGHESAIREWSEMVKMEPPTLDPSSSGKWRSSMKFVEKAKPFFTDL